MMRWLLRCSLIALSAVVAEPILAAVVDATPPHRREFVFSRDTFLKEAQDQELREAVALLDGGKVEEARLKLARVLKRFPRNAAALELSGVILMEMRNYAPAEAAFRRAIEAAPQRAGAMAKLGVVLALQGKLADAETHLEKAVALQPEEPLALTYLAWLAQTKGDAAGAIARYERVVAKLTVERPTQLHGRLAALYNASGRPAEAEAFLAPMLAKASGRHVDHLVFLDLLNAQLQQKNWTQAERTIARLEPLLPEGSPEGPLARAEVALGRGDREGARAALEAGLAASSDKARLHRQLAALARDAGDQAQTIARLEQAAAAASDSQAAAYLRELASAHANAGDHAKAIAAIERESARRPKQPEIAFLLAESKSLAGDRDGALVLLDQIVAANPGAVDAFFLAGVLRYHNGEHAKAETALRQAISLRPGHVDAWRALAATAHELRGDPAMLAVLKDAVRANPDDSRLLYDIGSSAYSEGRVAEAEATFRRILERDSKHAPALNDLALLLADEKRALPEARELAERAYALAPRDPVVADTRAWVMLRSGETEPALKALKEAASALPQDGGVQFHMGVAQLQAGEADAGRASLRKAMSLGLPERYRGEVKRLLDGGKP